MGSIGVKVNAPLVNLTLPVFNEGAQLADSVGTVCRFLEARFEFPCEVIIANNGSTDGTQDIADQLERQWPPVRAVHLREKGRGRALKQVWLASRAEVLTYMDVDLSTDLAAYPALVAAVAGGRHDVAVGSRTLPESRTTRGLKREFISRAYIALLQLTLRIKATDPCCGFKAIHQRAARPLLPRVEDTGFFFDTELLVLAERLGYRVIDLPVHWREDTDSRVNLIGTAWADLRGMLRLWRRWRQDTSRFQTGARTE